MRVLELKNLNISFISGEKELPTVSDVSFYVDSGEILALVGESGCGKSISCLAITKLLPTPPAIVKAEEINFYSNDEKIDLVNATKRELRQVRGGGIGYIFQEPSASLNPVFRVGYQIAEVLELHRPEVKDLRAEVVRLLEEVGIPDPESRVDSYPHELSGGMQQRVMIAMALAGKPELLIADEPTTALDVTIQAQILELIAQSCSENNMGVILVTHNLGIVAELANRVCVMYAGNIVESGCAKKIIQEPAHPYTKALLKAVPRPQSAGKKLHTIPGSVPSPDRYPAGCRFADRCELAETLCDDDRAKCFSEKPEDFTIDSEHFVNCHFWNTVENEK